MASSTALPMPPKGGTGRTSMCYDMDPSAARWSYAAYASSTRSRMRFCAATSVLARREGDVATTAAAALPDREPDQLQAFELAVGEVQLGIGEFAGRVAVVV